ncbi:MAG: glycosyltransferase family 2 protein [Bacteroidaceae bacterium]|nr:glycosyltransferase family 2 protein [Bacteroidaceae bacterium]MBR5606944.1 glycosyltransferase family 2 protein [Bacteroidaceae bacterium]
MKRVAVVILNWNGEKMLREFLPDVVRHSTGAEIVVADNASTDGSLQMLEREFPTVRRIVLDRNHGFAQGYHLALEQVDAEFYLLLNNDVQVGADWLSPLLEYMDKNPHVAACQPKLLCHWDRTRFEYAGASGGYIDAWGYPYCRGRVMGTVEEDKGQYDEPASLLWATGAALMIRREAYWQAGGLDGRFFAHQEEIDLCWRLRSRGYGIACVPQSKVWHVGGGTLPKDSPHKTYLNFRNNLLLLYKNLPSERLETVMRVRFWLDALASVQFLLTGKWGSFLAVWRGRRDFFRMRPQFVADRERNLKAAVLSPVPEQTAVSILWQYYARGKKTFKEIHPTENNNKQHI